MSVLVLVEHDGRTIKDATFAAVSAASKLGGVDLLVAGSNVAEIGKAAANIAGISKVLVADSKYLDHELAENLAPLASKLMENYDAFVAPATTFGKNIAPRVAALIDVMQVSDVIAIQSGDTFVRPIYAGNAIATVKSSDQKKVITVRTTAFDKASAQGGNGTIENVDTGEAFGKSEFVSMDSSQSERPELTSAKVIVSGGRAFGSSQQFHSLLDPLADKLGAAVGASRAAVDAATRPMTIRSGRPERSLRLKSILRSEFRRDPASCRNERFKSDRCNQQGRRGSDFPGRRHRACRRSVQNRSRADAEALGASSVRVVSRLRRSSFEQIRSSYVRAYPCGLSTPFS